jgi:U4/U6.U5 tri-snRNP-associated protein 2
VQLSDLARDLLPALPSVVEISSLSVADLKAFLKEHGVSYQDAVEKSDLQSRALELSSRPLADLMATKYDLVANICHDSPAGQRTEGGKKDPLEGGTYRVHVQNRASEQWYEIQDLHVQETMPQLIGLSESYIMVYSRKSSTST